MNKTFEYLHRVIQKATALHVAHFNEVEPYSLDEIYSIDPSEAREPEDRLIQLFRTHNFNFQEQIVLLLALAPHFAPQILDIFLAQNPNFGRICTEFGGVVEGKHRGSSRIL